MLDVEFTSQNNTNISLQCNLKLQKEKCIKISYKTEKVIKKNNWNPYPIKFIKHKKCPSSHKNKKKR